MTEEVVTSTAPGRGGSEIELLLLPLGRWRCFGLLFLELKEVKPRDMGSLGWFSSGSTFCQGRGWGTRVKFGLSK